MRQRQRGFTLLEMLVVIGIILVLMSILVMGYRHLNYTAARRETVAELKILQGMLTEYENANGHATLDSLYIVDPASGAPALQLTDAVGDMGDRSSANSIRYAPATTGPNAVNRTGYANASPIPISTVMNWLIRVPKNKAILDGIDAKRVLELPPGNVANIPSNVLLDGWGNPIIYVPRGGLHVQISDPSVGPRGEYIVRTSGIFQVKDAKSHPITAADRPFFASAGQDGHFTDAAGGLIDFATDNIYSFQE